MCAPLGTGQWRIRFFIHNISDTFNVRCFPWASAGSSIDACFTNYTQFSRLPINVSIQPAFLLRIRKDQHLLIDPQKTKLKLNNGITRCHNHFLGLSIRHHIVNIYRTFQNQAFIKFYISNPDSLLFKILLWIIALTLRQASLLCVYKKQNKSSGGLCAYDVYIAVRWLACLITFCPSCVCLCVRQQLI